MRVRSVAASSCLTVALAFGVAACGSSDNKSSGGSGSTGSTSLTIYSSLPLQGDSRPQSEAVVNGEKLALQEHGGKVGKFTIKYVSLDDSTAATGKWEPGATSANARKAAQDKSTIAYLGEFNSGASAISIPIINEAGILQVSPSNTYVGLTRSEGADKGEPDKYYPSGKRTYGRVVPADHIQAAAQVAYQKDQGCKKVYILNDKEVYGKGIADRCRRTLAKAQGIQIARQRRHRHQGRELPRAGRQDQAQGRRLHLLRRHHAEQGASRCARTSRAANPTSSCSGPTVWPSPPSRRRFGPHVREAARSSPTRPSTRSSTRRRRQDFFKEFKAKYGKDPGAVRDLRLRGDAASRSTRSRTRATRATTARPSSIEFFKIKDRDSVLGKYSIDENGDTTLSDYGGDQVEGRQARLRQGHQGPDDS